MDRNKKIKISFEYKILKVRYFKKFNYTKEMIVLMNNDIDFGAFLC